MIEIRRYHAGRCSNCNARSAEYSVMGEFDGAEWEGVQRPCQECMVTALENNERLRLIVMLQNATGEAH